MPGLAAQEATRGILSDHWHAEVGEYASALSWSACGDTLFVADAAGGMHAFASSSGQARWTSPRAHDGGIMALARHPRESIVASAGQDGRVGIWHAGSGETERILDVAEPWVEHLAWSPDGGLLAAASGRIVRVWLRSGQLVWCSAAHPSTVSALSWSKPTELVSACYGRVAFWSLPEGSLTQALEWKGSLISIALSPNGQIVACGSQDNTVHFWRRATGQDSMMSGYPNKPSALGFDAAGELLATGGGDSVTVWSFRGKGPENTKPGVLSLHPSPITTLRFAHRGRTLVSGDRTGGVVAWKLGRQGHGDPVGGTLVSGIVENIAWRPDDKEVAIIDGQGGVTSLRVKS